MLKSIFSFLFLIIIASSGKAQNITISGTIQDSLSGEKLIGVTIFEGTSKKGAITNNFGFYSLSVPSNDSIFITVSIIGYNKKNIKLKGNINHDINFKLTENTTLLNEVVVTDKVLIENSTKMSTLEISVNEIKKLPSFMGETDILKTFQLMPGVQGGNEGSNALYVRGGSPDQNLILLDDVPLYYVSHLGGFVSIFDANSISNVKLLKGGFPAQYGGRLSSVVDIRMKDGNENKIKGEFSLGTIAGKISLEGPLIKDNTTFVVTARRSFIDLLTRGFNLLTSNNEQQAWYNLYDLTAKTCTRLTTKDRLFVSFYTGRDKIAFKEHSNQIEMPQSPSKNSDFNAGIAWSNTMAALRWNHILNNKLFSNTTLSLTQFNYSTTANGIEKETETKNIIYEYDREFISGIRDFAFKTMLEYYPSNKHIIKTGAVITSHFFKPGMYAYKQQQDAVDKVSDIASDKLHSIESSLFIEDEYSPFDKLTINAGLHASGYFVNSKTFSSLQPRFISNYKLGKHSSIKCSFTSAQQNLHLLSNSGAGFPTDLWVPATSRITPEKSNQYAIGWVRSIALKKNLLELSIEAYYKTLSNLIEFQEGASFFSPQSWENKVVSNGKGRIWGIETLLQKKEGRLTGWIGYTYSKNDRHFSTLNNGKWFPYKFDRTHDATVVLCYNINTKINISCSWIYTTGNAVTLASEKYQIANYDYNFQSSSPPSDFLNYDDVHLYHGRNNYRMPSYHKMDVGINFIKELKRTTRTWNISIYNIYNHLNSYMLYLENKDEQTKLYKVCIFPFIPSVSYSLKF